MKTMIRHIASYLLAAAALAGATGCVDDFRPGVADLGEGETAVDVSVEFDLVDEVDITSRSGADDVGAGDIMDAISCFHMVLYTPDGKTFDDGKTYKCVKVFDNGEFCTSAAGDEVRFEGIRYELDDNRLPEESDLQDSRTGRLTYKLFLKAGYYYAYGVANIPELEDYDISTREKLRAIERSWEKGGKVTLAANDEMSGIFSVEPDRYATDDHTIGLRADGASMHCWLRRLASKLTVSFDGTDLFDDVEIYITDVIVHDVAKKCPLYNSNTPGRDMSSLEEGKMLPASQRYTAENGVIADGGSINYQTIPSTFDPLRDDKDKYLHVCNVHPYFGNTDAAADEATSDARHEHAATSIFFYENRQGEGKNKAQDAEGDGTIDYPTWVEGDDNLNTSGWKDAKAYGTWIEVKAIYRCSNVISGITAFVGTGPITYRFMLGNDAKKDYNVDRNTHYKLTMKFKGYGNEVDWHISYEEEPGIYAPTPQYVSYLYNKQSSSTIKIVGKVYDKNPYLYATIIGTDELPAGHPTETPPAGNGYREDEQTYWEPWGDPENPTKFPPTIVGGKITTDKHGGPLFHKFNGTKIKNGPWHGFLTLRKVKAIRIFDPDYVGAPTYFGGQRDTEENRTYFRNHKSGYAKYKVGDGIQSEFDEYTGETGTYTCRAEKDGDDNIHGYVFNIPVYTRAKDLITSTGFTGNNPYSAYPRRECVRYSIQLIDKDGNPKWFHTYVHYIQVRRIENPKGVWRRAGSSEPFHVTLMHHMDIDGEDDYQSFESEGKWSAEVIGDGIITLSTTTEGSGDNVPMMNMKKIQGATNCPVDFMINFNGTVGNAIVRVRYHNYSCEHDIFCRNGYDDVDLADNGTMWSSFNVYRFKSGHVPELTKSPLEAGSFFRRANYTAILESNNETYPSPEIPQYRYAGAVIPYNKNNPSTGNFDVLEEGRDDITQKTWVQLGGSSESISKNWTIGDGRQIADILDFYDLASPDDQNEALTWPINKAYGIVYADGATEVQSKVAMAHGYTRADGVSSPKGMRGIIIYNSDKNYRQIFLPCGASGYGRRKAVVGWNPSPKDYSGTLRYASRANYYSLDTTLDNVPLFWDIFRRPGAIYWCRRWQTMQYVEGKSYTNPRLSSAFDMNYFTMGFEGFENGAAISSNGSDSDALFIRTVKNSVHKNE